MSLCVTHNSTDSLVSELRVAGVYIQHFIQPEVDHGMYYLVCLCRKLHQRVSLHLRHGGFLFQERMSLVDLQ